MTRPRRRNRHPGASSFKVAKNLIRLRNQIFGTMKKMSWNSGFMTSKKSTKKFKISCGKTGLASVSAETDRLNGGVMVWVTIKPHDHREKFFGLSNTPSVKPWIRGMLKIMKETYVSHVMSS